MPVRWIPVRWSIAVLALVASGVSAQAQESPKGEWLRGDGVARVRVSPCGQALCMTNLWIKPGSDEKVGEYIVLNVTEAEGGVLKGNGRDPQRNVTFSAEVKVAGDTMTTSGCVAAVLCRSTRWSRVK